MSNNDSKNNLLVKAIIVCCVAGVSLILHQLLAAVGVHGNLVWLILNVVFVALNVINGIYALKFIVLPLKNSVKENVGPFVTGLVGMAISFINSFWWLIDAIRNLTGVISGNL